MNAKIKNYVDVLFKDIPNTRKASELKEEILSNLNEHFEEHISEGKGENQAYTESLADLGDVDELLSGLVPEREIQDKIDSYRKFRARNTAFAVVLYIVGVLCLIGPASICDVFEMGNKDKVGVIGLIALLVFAAIATGILVYTKMSVSQEVEPYLHKKEKAYDTSTKRGKKIAALMSVYWIFVTAIYLGVSFVTNQWGLTWLIWIIAAVIKRALDAFFADEE